MNIRSINCSIFFSSLSNSIIFNNPVVSLVGDVALLAFIRLHQALAPSFSTRTEIRHQPELVTEANINRIARLHLHRFPKETSLNYTGCGLRHLPGTIGHFFNLEKLNLTGNSLRSLPNRIWGLVNLKTLILARNELDWTLWHDDFFTHLSSLQSLDISENNLTSLPSGITHANQLRSLNLSRNQFESIPKEIGRLSNLKTLNLCDNPLTSLPSELENLSNLQLLDLSGTQITSLPLYLAKLACTSVVLINEDRLSPEETLSFQDAIKKEQEQSNGTRGPLFIRA